MSDLANIANNSPVAAAMILIGFAAFGFGFGFVIGRFDKK